MLPAPARPSARRDFFGAPPYCNNIWLRTARAATIGTKITGDATTPVQSPLLQRPGWRVRLAFFPADSSVEKPDYELGMLLLDNGVFLSYQQCHFTPDYWRNYTVIGTALLAGALLDELLRRRSAVKA